MLGAIEETYFDICREVSRRQTLHVLCYDEAHRKYVESKLQGLPRLHTWIISTNDTWIRDYGPLSVVTAQTVQYQDWTFDGWGGKFPASLDNQVNRQLLALGVIENRTHMPAVLEGGSIETNGHGLLLTTQTCLLTHGRNHGINQTALESLLKQALQVQSVWWLRHGILAGDDTDGHIDTLARFTSADRICYCQCRDPADEHYEELCQMEAELQALAPDRGIQLTPLPLPEPVYDPQGNRLPATYANFVIINGAVLVPVYDQASDGEAMTVLAGIFSDREIVPIPSLPLIRQGGSVHCATMQLPLID